MPSRTQRPLPSLFFTVTTALEQAVTAYQETGVFYCIDDASNGWKNRHPPLLYPFTMRKFMRAIAKEEKRPFIMAQETRYMTSRPDVNNSVSLDLIVPKRKKLEPIVAPLLLAAVPRRRYGHSDPIPNVGFMEGQPTIWSFGFYTDEGRALFAHWYEQCRVNPEFKRILNTHLPEEVTCSSSHSSSSSKSPKKPSLLSARA